AAALLPARPLPHHAWEAGQRMERLAPVSPIRRLLDGDMIARLPPGAALEQRTWDIHHLRRMCAHVEDRRATARAEVPRGPRRFVREACDLSLALGDAESAAPASDIGGVGGAMGMPATGRVIVPGPAGGKLDLEAHLPAQALP